MRVEKQVGPGFEGLQVPISNLPCLLRHSLEVLGRKSYRWITLVTVEGVRTGRNNEEVMAALRGEMIGLRNRSGSDIFIWI